MVLKATTEIARWFSFMMLLLKTQVATRGTFPGLLFWVLTI